MRAIIAAAVLAAGAGALGVATLGAGPASAADTATDHPYFGLSAGWYHPLNEGTGNLERTIDRFDGGAVQIALGHKYKDWRAEAEFGWAAGGMGSQGTENTVSAMVNAYYDFDTGTPLVPYLGGGAGMAYVSFNGASVPGLGDISDHDFDFAWQLMAGLGYRLDRDWTLFVGYRWFDASNVIMQSQGGTRVKLDGFGSHTVEVGMRYRL